MKEFIFLSGLLVLLAGNAFAQPPAGGNATANTTAAPAPAPANPLQVRTRLNPVPTPGSIALPAEAARLLSGYEQQAQEGLILAYFAAGTVGDALVAGSISSEEGTRQAASYLALATSARDDLKQVRGTYTLVPADLAQIDRLAVAYGDVIPLIQAAQRLALDAKDPRNLTDFRAARRQAFATLSALFGWQ